MSTRTSSPAWFALLLAACSQAAAPPPDPDSLIECAIGGAGTFSRECAVERVLEDGALVLTVRHPDGGFRRFAVTDDGTGVAPADGAEPATIGLREDGIEVAVGADRYRFPATVAGDGGR